MINGMIDDYIDKWKIRPSNLKRYLKPGSERFRKFLERNKLNEVEGCDVILRDVIEDRYHMEKDGIITFESFKLFESEEFKIHSLKQSLYKGIEKATNKMEKIIADYFDTNLGEIDIVDADKHTFKINNWENDDLGITIYSEEEIDVIIKNMIDHLYDELSKNTVKLTERISIDLSDLIKKDTFESKMESIFTKEFTIKIITDCLGSQWEFKGESQDHLIWIL
jgi:hypothetical protein